MKNHAIFKQEIIVTYRRNLENFLKYLSSYKPVGQFELYPWVKRKLSFYNSRTILLFIMLMNSNEDLPP